VCFLSNYPRGAARTLETSRKIVVHLIDDDASVRRGIAALLRAADFETVLFASGDEFLQKLSELELDDAVLLLDVCMPGIQGLDLLQQLSKNGIETPIIVMTAHGDIPMAVRAMKDGAIDFLQKPFSSREIMGALDRACALRLHPHKPNDEQTNAIADSYRSLTARESEVLQKIVEGDTNKEIARILGISPRTVEVYRQKIMLKMKAGNFAELIRMSVMLGVGGSVWLGGDK